MKNSSSQTSALKTPLNEILGTRGHIEVLRQLVAADSPMTHSELLERTGLSRQGVYDVVGRLAETGLVTYVGSGRRQQVTLRREYPLTDILGQLFAAERDRYQALLEVLHETFMKLETRFNSVWIFGKIAQGVDEYGDPVQIALLGEVRSVDNQTEKVRQALYEDDVEARYDVTIELRGVTVADLEFRKELIEGGIILLWGIDPRELLASPENGAVRGKNHQELDAQSLKTAKIWTSLLQKYPEIIPRTVEYLKRRIPQVRGGESKELAEWKHVLESMSFQRLKKFLESDAERAVRLRQSLPFWQVLTDRERAEFRAIQSEWKQGDE